MSRDYIVGKMGWPRSVIDWGAYFAAMKSLSSDPEYQKMMAEVGSISQAVDRTFIIGVDV